MAETMSNLERYLHRSTGIHFMLRRDMIKSYVDEGSSPQTATSSYCQRSSSTNKAQGSPACSNSSRQQGSAITTAATLRFC
jgi:hypothetical protein